MHFWLRWNPMSPELASDGNKRGGILNRRQQARMSKIEITPEIFLAARPDGLASISTAFLEALVQGVLEVSLTASLEAIRHR
jgi:hypothetical protein